MAKGAGEMLNTLDHSRDSAGLRYVYPVVSRRAGGVSVGVNLNPNNACNFRCIYCQVPDLQRGAAPPIDLNRLADELRSFMVELTKGDFFQRRVPEGARKLADVAISGNGEPTSATELPDVVELIGAVLAEMGLAGTVKPRLITNGSLVRRGYVQHALASLKRIGGEVWFKLDTGTQAGLASINGVRLTPSRLTANLRECAGLCPTWVQTCVFNLDGIASLTAELPAYLAVLEQVPESALEGVLLYTLARPSFQPEATRLSPMQVQHMESIAAAIRSRGLTVMVSP